jgi:histidine ammonia-lyase
MLAIPEGTGLDVRADGETLTLEEVEAVARDHARVVVPRDARSRISQSRRALEGILRQGETVYGVNTGFGQLADIRVKGSEVLELQRRIVLSHAAGVGEPLPPEAVRAAMLLRINTFAKGHSAVRTRLVDHLLRMLNGGVTPVVRPTGSLGASGDLAPLADIALVVIGQGEALDEKGERISGAKALRVAGLEPLDLAEKEGIALINGTQVMTGIGTLALLDMERLLRTELVATAVVADALGARRDAFDPRIFGVRPYPGARTSARVLDRLLEGGDLDGCIDKNIQDAYSIRCAPQVIGAAWDATSWTRSQLEIEVNSAGDNPLVFPDEGDHLQGGNFHGQPVAQALDMMAIVAADVATLSERHTNRLMNPALSGLPAFLAKEPGLDSGLMIAQYTAAALLEEMRALARPASVENASTSGDQEDHVSMGMHAAVKLHGSLEALRTVLAIELLAGVQALDFRAPKRPAGPVAAVYNLVRRVVPFYGDDRPLGEDVRRITELVRLGEVVRVAEMTAREPLGW